MGRAGLREPVRGGKFPGQSQQQEPFLSLGLQGQRGRDSVTGAWGARANVKEGPRSNVVPLASPQDWKESKKERVINTPIFSPLVFPPPAGVPHWWSQLLARGPARPGSV